MHNMSMTRCCMRQAQIDKMKLARLYIKHSKNLASLLENSQLTLRTALFVSINLCLSSSVYASLYHFKPGVCQVSETCFSLRIWCVCVTTPKGINNYSYEMHSK